MIIDEVRSKTDELIKLFEVIVAQSEKNDSWHEQLQTYDRKLNLAKEDLFQREKDFTKKQIQLEQERQFLVKLKNELDAKKEAIRIELLKLEQDKKEAEVKVRESNDKIRELSQKIIDADEVDKKLVDLRELEERLEKEKSVDRDRKAQLDKKAAENEREGKRLHDLSVRLKDLSLLYKQPKK